VNFVNYAAQGVICAWHFLCRARRIIKGGLRAKLDRSTKKPESCDQPAVRNSRAGFIILKEGCALYCALKDFRRRRQSSGRMTLQSALLGDPLRAEGGVGNLFRGFHLTFNPRGNHNGPPLRAVKFFHRFLSLSKTHKGVRKYYLYFSARRRGKK
jgi:hypothetical protein